MARALQDCRESEHDRRNSQNSQTVKYAEVDDTEFEELTSSWKESTSGKHVIPIGGKLRRQGNKRRCPGTKVADRIKMVYAHHCGV